MKNFTKQNFKTSPLWIRLLIMAFMVLAGVGNLSAAQKNIHWNGKVYFLAPETWNVDETYKYIQVDITRTTSATSSNHQEYIGNMTRLGTSRLFYVSVNANHSNWNQNEYIAFTANDHNYGSGSFRIDNNHYYTTPLDYGVKDGGYYLFKPNSKTELQTTTNANKITGIWASSRDDFKVDQTVQIYTNGSSSATGGTVKLTGYYLSSDNALSSSSETSSSTSAKYGSVPGTEMKLTATAKTGYKFDGWYTAATGGTKLSSDATYTYNVYEKTTVYARFLSKEYTITYKDQGNVAFSGDHASGYPTKHTYGTTTTLKTATKTGYTFEGWFTDSNCTTEVTSLGATAYTSNITLYAKWQVACSLPTSVSIKGATTPCASKTAVYNAEVTGGSDYVLEWSVTGTGYSVKSGQGETSATINIGTGTGSVKCTAKCSESSKEDSNTINIAPYSAKQPALSVYPTTGYICEGEKATISIADPELNVQTLTYQLYNETTSANVGNAISPTSKPIEFSVQEAGTYRVNVSHTCGGTQSSNKITINYYASPEIPKLILTKPTKCGGTANANGVIAMGNSLPGITYTLKKGNVTCPLDQDGTKWSGLEAGTYTIIASQTACTTPQTVSESVVLEVEEISPVATVSIISASYDMNAGTFTVSGRLDHAGCSESIYVGYRYKLSNDDTWSDLINTHHLTEAGIFTKEGISIAGAAAGQTYLFQTYAINGHPNYEESSAEFSSSTIDVEVQDGYTVYVRRPQSGDGTTVYTNWYELSSVKGGAPYVKNGAISGSSSNNQATTNNTGGTEMTYAFTDCDGYIWDSFKPAKDQTQFHIHALNDIQQGGWGTFSKTATITAGRDNYFYLSAWSSGTYGVTITSTSQPTRGVRIKVLGSTEVISTNMASFAAISFNGNCTGKELLKDAEGDPTGFQWKYSANGTSWSNYDGEGATWNNIRPTAAGKYQLVCTMEDMTTVESNIVTITTTSKTYNTGDLINIKSKLPIIMVNTGDNNGFPACSVAGSDYPSKHADKFKKKLSVDVKIKVGDNIVYDKKARMAYRGSSSLNFKKKSYAFCPGADMCGLDEDKSPDYVDTKKIDMLDLITGGTKKSAKDKDWVLYAATPDPSMMRNILAMETFSAMTGKWGVKNQYVELYVDGVYQGVYVFMDKITQNKGRVNVEWKVDGSSKGFIVKFDKTDLADRYEIPNGDQKTFESAMKTGNTGVISYGTEIDQRFEIEYPEKEDVIDDGGSWADVYTFVKGKIDAFESALKDGDFNTVRTIIDYESWADFFILTEFAKNGDGYRASCVFVYEGGLLKAYPLWDYELSFDNETRQEHGIQNTTGLLVNETSYSKVSGENGTFPAPFWWTGNYYNQKTYKGLLDDPCFVAMVNARWTKHTTDKGALTKTKMDSLVSAYNTALTTTDATGTYNTPQKREQQKWPYNGTTRGLTCNDKGIGYYGQGAGSASSEVETFSTSKTTLDAWIGDSGRRGGLDTEIENLAKDIKFAITVVADKTTTTPWRPVTITVNSNSGYEYSITPEPAKLEENGHMYTLYFARPERTEGTNFDTINDAYTFTATTGQADQCGTTQGSTTSAEVKIDLADVVENCPQP